MKAKFTLSDAYSSVRGPISEELDRISIDAAAKYNSPDYLGLILWNVVIAFFVSLSASAVFEGLKGILDKNGYLTRREIEESKEVIENADLDIDIKLIERGRRSVKRVIEIAVRSKQPNEVTERIIDKLVEDLRANDGQ